MFTHIANIIPKAIRTYGLTRQAKAALICEKYRKVAPSIFSAEILINAWPKYFKGKTLVLGVSHPAYAEEVSQRKHKLKALLNESLGKDYVAAIKTVTEENPEKTLT